MTGAGRLFLLSPLPHICTVRMTDTMVKLEGEGERRGPIVGYDPTTISRDCDGCKFLVKLDENTIEERLSFTAFI